MKLSVVILNYNVRYFLEQCIRSVQKAIASMDAEIIVIDNDSKDGSCEMVKTHFPDVTLIENKENVGFSKANNQGVAVAKGDYVCILNPDTAVTESAFEKALDYYKKTESIGALGVYLMDGTGSFLPESKRNLPTPKVSLLKLLGFGSKYYADYLAATDAGPVEVLVGAFMMMKRDIYNEVGGFDEDYFMYGEDIDLSYKITQAGYQNHYLGNATVLHYKGESTKKDDAYFDRFYGAMKIFNRKHFSKNILMEGAVSIGVTLAKLIRKSTMASQPHVLPINNVLVLTEDDQFVQKLSAKMDMEVHRISKSQVTNTSIEKSIIVFDASFVVYSEIFAAMKKLSGKGNRFRIKPPATNFLVGSDKSDEKGEVMVF